VKIFMDLGMSGCARGKGTIGDIRQSEERSHPTGKPVKDRRGVTVPKGSTKLTDEEVIHIRTLHEQECWTPKRIFTEITAEKGMTEGGTWRILSYESRTAPHLNPALIKLNRRK